MPTGSAPERIIPWSCWTNRSFRLEADIDSDVDARAMAAASVRSIQLHTGGMCHLDADMTRQGLDELLTESGVELAVLENVGNLVCPAGFDTWAVKNAAILSAPEVCR